MSWHPSIRATWRQGIPAYWAQTRSRLHGARLHQGRAKYDVGLDSVGKSLFGQCWRLLKPGGMYHSSDLGPLAQNPLLGLIAPLQRGRKVMFPIPKHDQEMVRHFRDLIESGEFKPVIDRTYRLDQIVEAYRYVETGQKTGDVVIRLEHSH